MGYGLAGLYSRGINGFFENLSLMFVLFLSVVLHELGHALVARRFKVPTAHITLYPFGGIAALRSEPKSAKAEFWIAIAGPLVNVLLMLLSGLAWFVSGWMPFALFAGLNLVMAVFNLIPAFPMDGGRVLRAGLSPILGWWRASTVAIYIGRLFAFVFVALGLYWMSYNLMLVGGFLWFATGVERRKMKHLRQHVRLSSQTALYQTRWKIRPKGH